MQRQRKEQGERTRQTIIEVTTRLFAARGYAGTSLDLIAKEANTSKSSIFWHFKNKEDLLFTVVDQALSQWESHAGDQILAQPDPPRQLARLLLLYRELAEERPHTLRLLIGLLLETADGNAAIRARFQRIYEGYRKSIEMVIAAGVQKSNFAAPIAPAAAAQLILSQFDGLFVQRFLDPQTVGPDSYDALVVWVFAVLMPGKGVPQPVA